MSIIGEIRDFRKETIDHIRENLVDQNPNWDAVWDWVWGWGIFDIDLKDDLSNMDDYMRRICEINDVTKEKLDEIVADVHGIETLYAIFTDGAAEEYTIRKNMFDAMKQALQNPDFERRFDPTALDGVLSAMVTAKAIYDLSGFSNEMLGKLLEALDTERLLNVDPSKLNDKQRELYYEELYRRLREGDLTPEEREQVLIKLGLMTPEDERNLIFDEDDNATKTYGGDQGAPMDNWDNPLIQSVLERFPDIKAQYYPGMTKREIIAFLKMFNEVGCGYIAAANGIFVQYASRPDEFERIFGFPMYDKNGKWNINALAILLFCQHNSLYSGVYQHKIIPVAEEFGTDSNVECFDGVPSKEVVEKAFAEGKTVIVNVAPVVLYDAQGEQKGDWTSGGYHAMTVTAVASDGSLTVSSWGNMYTIKASEFSLYTTFNYEVVSHG